MNVITLLSIYSSQADRHLTAATASYVVVIQKSPVAGRPSVTDLSLFLAVIATRTVELSPSNVDKLYRFFIYIYISASYR